MGMKKKLSWSKLSAGGVSVWIDFAHREYRVVKDRNGYTDLYNGKS